MEADWSVELAADDPVLEMPWTSPDGALRWQDLRRHPELIPQLAECHAYPELIEPLQLLNSPTGTIATAKCDVFAPEPTEPAEELYGAWRLVSYIDAFFAGEQGSTSTAEQFDFATHERFARDLSAFLNDLPDGNSMNASFEAVVRRCVYDGSRDGFYVTLYVIGYGAGEEDARKHWARALSASAAAVAATCGPRE